MCVCVCMYVCMYVLYNTLIWSVTQGLAGT